MLGKIAVLAKDLKVTAIIRSTANQRGNVVNMAFFTKLRSAVSTPSTLLFENVGNVI